MASVKKNQIPVERDDGVPNGPVSREWIENVLRPAINPPLPGLHISQIPLSETKSYYAISVPKSHIGPHQGPDKRFYKRYNFSSCPMDVFEIDDVRLRRLVHDPLVSVDIEVNDGWFILAIANPGSLPAHDVSLVFTPALAFAWQEQIPPALANGIKHLPPSRRLRFLLAMVDQVFDTAKSMPTEYSVRISYLHPARGQRVDEIAPLSLSDYIGSTPGRAPANQIAAELRRIAESIRDAERNSSFRRAVGSKPR